MAHEGLYSVLPTAFSDTGGDQERVRVLESVISQTARCVPAGARMPAGGTRAAIAYSHQAKQLGVGAIINSLPPPARLNSEAALRHYKALADAQKGLEWISV